MRNILIYKFKIVVENIKTQQMDEFHILPGDSVDVTSYGLFKFYTEEEAVAIRILDKLRQKEIRDVIERVKKKNYFLV